MIRIIRLSGGDAARNLDVVLEGVNRGIEIVPVATLEELRAVELTADTWLISHSTNVILSEDLINALEGRAINIHAASPAYPGRDPHHFAIYDGATRYGATAHFMTAKVDDGAILDVEWFDVAADETPSSLLAKANAASLIVAKRLLPNLMAGKPKPNGDHWGARKTTRRAFLALCEITCDMSATEIERRRRAVAVPGRANLFVSIAGIRFTHNEPV